MCEILAEKNPVYAAKIYARLDTATSSSSAVYSNTGYSESDDAVGTILGEPQEQVEIKEEEVEYDEGVEYHEEEVVTST